MSAPRKWILRTHLSLGMVAGLLMSLTGLTGSLLVFGDEIDRLLNPALLRVQPAAQRVPFDKVMLDVRSAFPDRRIARLHLPYEPDSSLEVCFAQAADPSCVYVNPYTGATLGIRVPTRTFKGQLLSVHRRLLSGVVGETIVGVEGALLIALSLTGLILWMQARRPVWRKRPSTTPTPYVRWFDLHRLVGGMRAAAAAVARGDGHGDDLPPDVRRHAEQAGVDADTRPAPGGPGHRRRKAAFTRRHPAHHTDGRAAGRAHICDPARLASRAACRSRPDER